MKELIFSLPIWIIALSTILIILVDALSKNERNSVYIFSLIALIATGVGAAYTLSIPKTELATLQLAESISKGMLNFGGFSAIFDIIFVIAAILTVISAKPYLNREYFDFKEFYSLVVFAVAGMIFIVHAANLLMIFIGIELMSISFYVLSGFVRNKIAPVEAALKYFLLGAFATGFLLYGMAMIYGATGTMNLNDIYNHLVAGSVNLTYLKVGMALMVVGLSFKVAAFPFHQWAPDVYHGAPTVVTGFMSTAGKAAALAAFIIVAKALLPGFFNPDAINDNVLKVKDFVQNTKFVIALIAAGTMLVGNLSALVQKNVKRMLAYSSVAHAGYLLMGIVANNNNGFAGIVFYTAAYTFMQIGAFVIASTIERNQTDMLTLKDYSGLRKSHPYLAAAMAIFMFSLAGIPLFAGFPGKYLLFLGAIQAGYTWLTIVAVVATMISMFFYIGLIIYMYFYDGDGNEIKADVKSASIVITLSAIAVFILGIFPAYLIDLAKFYF